MSARLRGRPATSSRPLVHWAAATALALIALSGGLAQAMWAQMTDAELIQSSQWIVVGEWVGQAPLRITADGAAGEVAAISVLEVLRGPAAATVAFVAVPGPSQPVSSTDLRFKRGDRGVWFLRSRSPGAEGMPFVVDHPQRFVRDTPANAATIAALRRQLQRR